MLNPVRKFVVAASLGAGIASSPNVASALPMLDPLTIKNAAPPAVEQVQWRRGWGWGWGRGAPVAAGVVAGAVVGSAVAASAYGPYYPGPYYPAPAPAYGYPAYPAPAYGGYPPPVGLLAAIPSRRPALPVDPLETLWPTACSATGHIIRKPEPILGPTANVILAPERREASATIHWCSVLSEGRNPHSTREAEKVRCG